MSTIVPRATQIWPTGISRNDPTFSISLIHRHCRSSCLKPSRTKGTRDAAPGWFIAISMLPVTFSWCMGQSIGGPTKRSRRDSGRFGMIGPAADALWASVSGEKFA